MKFDYKAIAYLLVGAILGCGFHRVINTFLNTVGFPAE